jgi:hypothetical protein
LLHFLELPPENRHLVTWHLILPKPRSWEQFGLRPNDGSEVPGFSLNGAIGSLANLQAWKRMADSSPHVYSLLLSMMISYLFNQNFFQNQWTGINTA